jgi:hypothetical protein
MHTGYKEAVTRSFYNYSDTTPNLPNHKAGNKHEFHIEKPLTLGAILLLHHGAHV